MSVSSRRFFPMKGIIMIMSLISPFRIPIFAFFLFSFAWTLWDSRTVYKLILLHSVLWILMSWPIYVVIFESMNSVFIQNLIIGSYSMSLTFLFYGVFFGGLIFTQFIIVAWFSKILSRWTKKYIMYLPGVDDGKTK